VNNKYRSYFLILFTFALAACSKEAPQETSAESVTPALNSLEQGLATINRDGIESHLLFLADDARMYVAERFAEIGLEPGGDDGWFQQVPMLARRIDVDSTKFIFHQDDVEKAQRWKEDFVMGGDTVRAETNITAEVVYVGFGIHAPDMNYSDYDGIDVEGKIIAAFGGAPDSFPHNERAYYSSGLTKAEEAVARGAVGYVGLRSRTDQRRYTWERLSENAGVRPGMSWLNLSGEAANFFPELQGGAMLNVPPAHELFSRAPISFEQALDAADAGTPLSTPLGTEITLARKTDHETINSPNVIGILRGSDPELANEYVVFTAHLDHVGTGVPINGDTIYNGMYDNAMGTNLAVDRNRACLRGDAGAATPFDNVHCLDGRRARSRRFGLFCTLSDGANRFTDRQRESGHAFAAVPAGGRDRIRCGTFVTRESNQWGRWRGRLQTVTGSVSGRSNLYPQRPVLIRQERCACRVPRSRPYFDGS
jgi:hypothetical protein